VHDVNGRIPAFDTLMGGAVNQDWEDDWNNAGDVFDSVVDGPPAFRRQLLDDLRLIRRSCSSDEIDALQRIEAKRLGLIKKPTHEFEWPSDTVIGRYFHPDGMPPMRDASVVRVVLKYLPDGHPPYSIVTTYPREALSG
jgi:hypothetical protein